MNSQFGKLVMSLAAVPNGTSPYVIEAKVTQICGPGIKVRPFGDDETVRLCWETGQRIGFDAKTSFEGPSCRRIDVRNHRISVGDTVIVLMTFRTNGSGADNPKPLMWLRESDVGYWVRCLAENELVRIAEVTNGKVIPVWIGLRSQSPERYAGLSRQVNTWFDDAVKWHKLSPSDRVPVISREPVTACSSATYQRRNRRGGKNVQAKREQEAGQGSQPSRNQTGFKLFSFAFGNHANDPGDLSHLAGARC